jgi:acyl-CoA thioester hydrolase
LLPAKYDDEIEVETTIVELKGPKITFHYRLVVEEQLIAKAITSLVFVDKNSMRPIRPPENFVNLITEFKAIKS